MTVLEAAEKNSVTGGKKRMGCRGPSQMEALPEAARRETTAVHLGNAGTMPSRIWLLLERK